MAIFYPIKEFVKAKTHKFNKTFVLLGENLCYLASQEFLHMTTIVPYIKEKKNDYLTLIKMQIFLFFKDTIKKIEKQVMYWKKIFPKYISVEAASWSLGRHNIVNKLQHALSPGDLGEDACLGSWQWTLSTTGVSRVLLSRYAPRLSGHGL